MQKPTLSNAKHFSAHSVTHNILLVFGLLSVPIQNPKLANHLSWANQLECTASVADHSYAEASVLRKPSWQRIIVQNRLFKAVQCANSRVQDVALF